MDVCDTCGNEIPGNPAMCPYCGSPQTNSQTSPRKQKQPKSAHQEIMTLNLEAGMPEVEQALARIDIRVSEARQQGVSMIRLIHGYGSSGVGGRIKKALPRHLADLKRRRIIRGFVHGENYAISTRQGDRLLSKYRTLKDSLPTDRKNPGITFIEL